MADLDTARQAKAAIRKRLLAQRRSLAPLGAAQMSEDVRMRLNGLAAYNSAKVVSSYWSQPDEVDTHTLIAELMHRGATVCVPSIVGEDLVMCQLTDPAADIFLGPHGVGEVRPERRRPVAPSTIDLVLVPGVAFDHQGFRLGRGKGYYDRFLGQVSESALKVGLAFSFQVVAVLPHLDYDVPVDVIATPDATITCSRRARSLASTKEDAPCW